MSKPKPRLCILLDPFISGTLERLTEEGDWVPATDGNTPSLAFSGKDVYGFPRAWCPEKRRGKAPWFPINEIDQNISRIAMEHTCNRYSCSNGGDNVKVVRRKPCKQG